MTVDDPDEPPIAPPREISGKVVVIAVLVFSVLMTGSLFVYWELYTRPFRPLQDAIAARFPESNPRVIGGRHKSHQADSPLVLRIVLRTLLDPRDNESAMRHQANELMALLQQHTQVSQYDLIEIHLMHRRPEAFIITWSLKAPPAVFPIPEQGELPTAAKRSLDEGEEGT